MPIKVYIRFEIPPEIRDGFPRVMDLTRRHIVRQALRSALLPCRNSLKAKFMSLTRSSKGGQSSGASMRAITSKYRNHRTYPNVFYGMIGVHRKYIEAYMPNEKSPVYRAALMRQVAFGIRGKVNREGIAPFQKRWQRQEVRSFLRRRYGVGKSGGRRRKPSAYLHLLEFGFRHRSGTQSIVHAFVQKTIAETEDQAKAIFKEKILEHFRKVFK